MITPGDWHTSPAPELEDDRLLDLLARHWRLEGDLERLYAERDLNHRLTTPAGDRWLVKLSHPDSSHARLSFEHRVLSHLAGDPTAPAVPSPRPTLDGETLVEVPDVGQLRVLSWLRGNPFDPEQICAVVRETLGATCARLNESLARFDQITPTPGTTGNREDLPRELPWDLQRLLDLAPLLDRLPEPSQEAERVLVRHAEHVAAPLATLPRQVIHNDLNPDNVLVDGAGKAATVSVIDFGDMVLAPTVCDLAILCAYLLVDSVPDSPGFEACLPAIRGFHHRRPLIAMEQALLPELVAGRLSQTLLIQGTRVKAGQTDAQASWRSAVVRLSQLKRDGLPHFAQRIRETCRTA